MRKNKGFTLMEMLIVFVIIGCVLVLCGYLSRGCWMTRTTDRTISDAKAFGREATGEVDPKVVCNERDTDGDGYVSCTVFRKDGKSPIPIECARGWTFNSGCRMQRSARQ